MIKTDKIILNLKKILLKIFNKISKKKINIFFSNKNKSIFYNRK